MNMEAGPALASEDDENIGDVYLTFQVGGETYAVGVEFVTEIVRVPEISAMPEMSKAFRGLINLRGHVIPILDMQVRFGLAAIDTTDRTVIIVIETESSRVGLMVPEVAEVREIAPDDISSARRELSHSTRDSRLVKGFNQRGSRVCMILDVARLLEQAEDGPSNATETEQ
ncbi:MAG: chemotaxis protein CheW [Myxococcota bacterium]